MSIDPSVVVGVDGSAVALDAVRWAADDAAAHRIPLHVVGAVSWPVDYGPGIAWSDGNYKEAQRTAAQAVAEAVEIARHSATDALNISTEIVAAPPIPLLLTQSKAARMVVVGSRGLGALKRGLLGSVSTALVRHAHCPVAVVHESNRDPAADSTAPVVVGIDGSPCSRDAIAIALDEASYRGVDVVAVHACGYRAGDMSWFAMEEAGKALVSESLAGYRERYPDLTVRTEVVEGRPVGGLLTKAQHAQLVVLGSHGRGGFAGMTLGSTSQAVLHSVQCPLIVARPR